MRNAFPVDCWWCAERRVSALKRNASPAYTVQGEEPVVVLSFTQARTEEGRDLRVETQVLSDSVLDAMLTQLVVNALESAPEHSVPLNGLADFMGHHHLEQVFAHPTAVALLQNNLKVGTVWSCPNLPLPPDGDLPIYAAKNDIGCVVEVRNPHSDNIERGAVLRPSQFMRIKIEAELRSALDLILDDD